MKLALFRADGSHRLGLGHVMRCLAFAQQIAEKGIGALFLTRRHEPQVLKLIENHGHEVVAIPRESTLAQDGELTVHHASRPEVRLIITDLSNSANLAMMADYRRYFQRLQDARKFMIIFDEMIDIAFPQALQVIPYYGTETDYPGSRGGTRLLLGPRYFVFRDEFREAAHVRKIIRKDARNILVTMGGSDPSRLSAKVARSLVMLKEEPLHLRFIIGGSFDRVAKEEIESVLRGYPGSYRLIESPKNMAEQMLWADLAIVAGGLTKYEAAVTGTPAVILAHSDDEERKSSEFARGGSAIHLGNHTRVSELNLKETVAGLLGDNVLRAQMSQKGREMVDGRGGERIIAEIPREVLA